MAHALFDSDFMQKLEYLTLISRKLFRGRSRGEHQTYRKGSSLEFHDYRSYQPGDDFRYIDWNIYSRMNRLFVKLFAAEEDLSVHILLDSSRSMAFGNPAKIDYAKKIAAALAYIALLNLDRIGATTFSDSLGSSLPPFRRRGATSIFDYFSEISAGGTTAFNESLASYASKTTRPGLAIILSDLLDPKGYENGLLSLLYRRFDIMVIHTLSEDEIDPSFSGSFQFTDCESGSKVKVTMDPPVVDAYRSRLRRYFNDLESFCLNHSMEYVRSSTVVPFEDLVLKYLRQGMYLH